MEARVLRQASPPILRGDRSKKGIPPGCNKACPFASSTQLYDKTALSPTVGSRLGELDFPAPSSGTAGNVLLQYQTTYLNLICSDETSKFSSYSIIIELVIKERLLFK